MTGDSSGIENARDDDPQASSTPAPAGSRVDRVADELRAVAGLRSRNAIRDRSFPTLVELLPPDARDDPEARYAALQQLIEAGLEAMPDGDHRRAATSLLSYGSGRWRPLTKRGSEAAAAFGLGWDAYRRRRDSTGSSLVMETLTELAGVIVAADVPEAAPPPPGEVPVASVHLTTVPVAHVVATLPPPTRRSARLVGGAVAVVVVVAAAAFALWGPRSHEPAADPVNCGNLTYQPGDHVEGANEQIVRLADEFATMGADLPDGGGACAGVMSQRDGVVYQEVSPGIAGGVSAIVAAEDGSGEVVVLDHLEFVRFRSEAWDSTAPGGGIGIPVARSDRSDGPRVVDFTNGVIVQERADLPAVAVSGERWVRWLDAGGFDGRLGAPVSDVYDLPGANRVQEFSGGRIEVGYRTGDIVVADHAPEDLALPADHVGALLVSRGIGTSWYVDRAGARHWVPTSNDFGCVKEYHNAAELNDVPHAAIARLPAGEPFRCR